MRHLTILTTLVLLASPAWCDDEPDEPQEPGAPPPARSVYLGGYGGVFLGREQPGQLVHADTGIAFGMVFSQHRRPRLITEFDMLLAFRNYDTPSGIAFAADELILESLGILYSLKIPLATGRAQPFVGAGGGLMFTKLEIPSSLVLFATRLDEDAFGFVYQLYGGVEFVLDPADRKRLSLEIREVRSELDFDAVPGGDLEVGGRAYVISYRRRL